MNRLFKALSEMEMNQPSLKGVPRLMSQHVVMHLDVQDSVLAPPMPSQESETELLQTQAGPSDLSVPDLGPQIADHDAEMELLPSESVLPDFSESDLISLMSALYAETELLSPESISSEDSRPDVTSPMSAPDTETELPSPESVSSEDSRPDLISPMSAPDAKTELLSPESVSSEDSRPDVTSPMSAPDAETELPSPKSVSSEDSRPDLILSDELVVRMDPTCPTQETAVAKDSQPKSAESATARPVRVRVPPESRLVALTDPNSLGAEKFRALVTRLDHLYKQSELKCFQVTSSVIHEGKTVVSGNLAVTLAKYIGSKTLLIEGDLHRPALATMFGLNKMRGLSHWWSGRDQDLAQFVHQLDDLPLWFLPAGNVCARPSDILRSARFAKAFEQLASQFEWIVVDSTPMLPIVDVNLWSRLVDGTLLVVREGVTPVKALKQGLRALDHPKLIGVVLNEASATNEVKYAGQYYGSPKRK